MHLFVFIASLIANLVPIGCHLEGESRMTEDSKTTYLQPEIAEVVTKVNHKQVDKGLEPYKLRTAYRSPYQQAALYSLMTAGRIDVHDHVDIQIPIFPVGTEGMPSAELAEVHEFKVFEDMEGLRFTFGGRTFPVIPTNRSGVPLPGISHHTFCMVAEGINECW